MGEDGMKKTCILLLSIGLLLAGGCSINQNEETAAPNGEDEDMEKINTSVYHGDNCESDETVAFNHANTTAVIKEALDSTILEAEDVMRALLRARVHGAIRAELVERPNGNRPFLEIESEDNRIYHLNVTRVQHSSNYSYYIVESIIDVETDDLIYFRDE